MEKYYVYIHFKKNTDIPFYIGKGSNNRLNSSTRRNQYWKNTFHKHGFDSLKLEDNLTELESFELEKYWISQFKTWGFNLTNLTEGGEGKATTTNMKFGNKTNIQKLEISRTTKLGMNNPHIKEKCSKGAYITHSKIFTKDGKLRPDIIEKKREASKVKVLIVDNDTIIKEYDSIDTFRKIFNISYKQFRKISTRTNNTRYINNTLLKEF